MSKTKTNDEVPVDVQDTGEAQAQTQEEVTQQPKTTKQMLTANSREELAEAFEALKAQNPDKTLMAGAVGQKDDGTFEIQVDFVTN